MTPPRRFGPARTGAITIVSSATPTIVGAEPPEAVTIMRESALPSAASRGPEAALAALMPLLFLPVAAAPLAAGGGLRMIEVTAGAGLWGLVTLGALGAGTIFTPLLLYVVGRGVRVPLVLVLLAAALPWAGAGAAAFFAVPGIAETAGEADLALRGPLLAGALESVLAARALGTLVTCALFAGAGFGLALGAVGRDGVGRRSGAGALGFLAGLPVVAAVVGIVGLSLLRGVLSPSAGVLPLVALGGLLALAVAAAAAGRDAPHARSAALAAAVPVALGLALMAGAAMATSLGTFAAFGAMASVEPSDRLALAVGAAGEMAPLALLGRYGWAVTLVPVAAVGVWAAVRGGASVGRVIGAVLVLALAGGLVVGDRFAVESVAAALETATAPPWAGTDGFAPVSLRRGGEAVDVVDATVVPERVVPRKGKAVPLGKDGAKDPAALAAALGALLGSARPPEAGKPDVPAADGPAVVRDEPSLVLAVDRRVSGAALKAVLDAAGAAGARAVRLVGALSVAVDEDARAAARRRLPLLGAWGAPAAAVRVLLAPALPPGHADTDVHLLHTTVEKSADVAVRARASDPIAPIALAESAGGPTAEALLGLTDAGEAPVVYVALGGEASAGVLADAAERIAALRLRPLVVTGPLPGHPDEPASLPDEAGFGIGGPGVGLGLGAHGPEAPGGSGGLDKEVIRRVIRAHGDAMKRCYEKELVHTPKLAGKVSVAFTITPTGKVAKAKVAESTVGNAAVEKCVVEAFGKLVFPKPEKGPVEVTYPVVFRTSG